MQNSGTPCADSFFVRCTYCLIKVDDSHSRLLVNGGLFFKKSVWKFLKGIVVAWMIKKR